MSSQLLPAGLSRAVTIQLAWNSLELAPCGHSLQQLLLFGQKLVQVSGWLRLASMSRCTCPISCSIRRRFRASTQLSASSQVADCVGSNKYLEKCPAVAFLQQRRNLRGLHRLVGKSRNDQRGKDLFGLQAFVEPVLLQTLRQFSPEILALPPACGSVAAQLAWPPCRSAPAGSSLRCGVRSLLCAAPRAARVHPRATVAKFALPIRSAEIDSEFAARKEAENSGRAVSLRRVDISICRARAIR